MTRGELRRDRWYVKHNTAYRKVRMAVLNWVSRYGETVANVIFFAALFIMLGAVGNIELSDGFPKSSVVLMLVCTGYVAVFAVLKQGD